MGNRSKAVISMLLLVALSCFISIFPQPGQMFGTYEFCVMACTTIQVRPDGTFTYRDWGDVGDGQEVAGTWSYQGATKLRAISTRLNPPEVRASKVQNESDFHIKVVDQAGASIPGAQVVAYGVAQRFETGFEGTVTIPRCPGFEVDFPGFERVRYLPSNSQSNDFTVTLQVPTLQVDEGWLILYGRLYILGPDGEVYWGTEYLKLTLEETGERFR